MSALPQPAGPETEASAPEPAPPGPGLEAQQRLLAAWPDAEGGTSADGIHFVRVPVEQIAGAAALLGDELGFGRFIDLTAVDHPELGERFELQYLFYSMQEKIWLRLKTRTDGQAPSITPRFAGANWHEREVWDLFGVEFVGHPDLTRIMLPDDWQGHPLRRDEATFVEPVDFTVTREIYGT